ncbi:class I SAM-dependent methyltransferase [Actinomycetospora termitidis]|uniref:Class I SAM-dependent methyltransferase n=1 Tax=Actinomycetospora termitidis TaxID=3053470 RepID=A0ABT7M5Q2_9PSEU|nr:class I SAM-dependent methyltransferase [Actinomycetospora sp. Odt1-22]MDL5155991.1 class I SAM-dependent methyltransferase [Actinomycetospora sp. Odt1-22]
MTFPGVAESPNIWRWPDVYEAENAAQDATGALWEALEELVDLSGDVLDVGCGDGYHLPRFATTARSVTGVEPHPPLVARARARCADLPSVSVLPGSAAALPLSDASADVVHARTAYFFGPGCEPGLAEAERVLRPGGTLVIVDLDATRHSYGSWMRASAPGYDPRAAERFFTAQGFSTRRVDTLWRFTDRATMGAVLRIEFTPAVADKAVDGTPGLALPVAYRIHVRRRPAGLVAGR